MAIQIGTLRQNGQTFTGWRSTIMHLQQQVSAAVFVVDQTLAQLKILRDDIVGFEILK